MPRLPSFITPLNLAGFHITLTFALISDIALKNLTVVILLTLSYYARSDWLNNSMKVENCHSNSRSLKLSRMLPELYGNTGKTFSI